MGNFEGDDHRETKDMVFVEIIRCLIVGVERKAKRENWADFRISASYLPSNSEYFKE